MYCVYVHAFLHSRVYKYVPTVNVLSAFKKRKRKERNPYYGTILPILSAGSVTARQQTHYIFRQIYMCIYVPRKNYY